MIKPFPTRDKPKNKYGARAKECRQGHTHRSEFEADHCNELRARQKNREFYAYSVEREFKLIVNGALVCTHYPDFTILNENKLPLAVEETKGKATAEWKIKLKLFKALNPALPYTVFKKKKGSIIKETY